MKKIMSFVFAITLSVILLNPQNCISADKKAKANEEKKSLGSVNPKIVEETKSLVAEMKLKESEERKKKLKELSKPDPTDLKNIDQLATNTTKSLESTIEFNVLVPEMYKRTIGETIDGVTDVTVKKPSGKELLALAENIANQIKSVSELSKAVPAASDEVKSAGFMKAAKAAKSLNYSKDVLAITAPELELNLKVVKNLIETLKSSGNY